MPGLARELPTEFAGDTAGRLWLRSAAFRLSFSIVPWLAPSSLAITTFPFSDSTANLPYNHRGQQPSVAKTWRNELVVSSTLQVHHYGVSLKWATGESDGENGTWKGTVACRRWISRLMNKLGNWEVSISISSTTLCFLFFFFFDDASSENCNKVIP